MGHELYETETLWVQRIRRIVGGETWASFVGGKQMSYGMNRLESDLVHDIHCYLTGPDENVLIGAGSDGILQQEFDVLNL